MIRSAASKVLWVGRATVFLVGLAVILALLFGAASMAFAKDGDPWLLGRSNVATAITKLAGAAGVNGPMLQLINNNAGVNDTALDLRVQAGEAPMRVNRATKVTNLNADKLDGSDAPLWAVVNINADHTITVTRSKGVVSSSKLGTGAYKIQFDRNVSGCASVATIDQSQVGFISAQVGSFVATGREVVVSTYDSDGTAAERPFQLVVYC